MTEQERFDLMRDEIIDLKNEINRLQAENNNYNEVIKQLNQKDCDVRRLQAENERLEIECEKQYEIAEATIRAEIADGGTSCHWCEDTLKAQAYKECIEKVWELAVCMHPCSDELKILGSDLDNLLKEFERKENITYDN